MKSSLFLASFLLLRIFAYSQSTVCPKLGPGPKNKLSEKERSQGYRLLFDGKSTDQWRGAYLDSFPQKAWVVIDNTLAHLKFAGAESTSGGDIITKEEYADFTLSLEWKIEKGGNSGIKYYVVENFPKPAGSALGLEFQILDDDNHPDALKGMNGNRKAGSVYDLIPAPANKKLKKVGEWNHAVVMTKGNHVEHWLNGKLTASYDRDSEAFKALVAGSKYKDKPGFGTWPKGHILLQDHGDLVQYRSIKIKRS